MADFHRTDSSAVCLLQFDGTVSDVFSYIISIRGDIKKGEELTIHLLPSIQEVLRVRESDKAVLGLVSNEQLYNSETKTGHTF
jgi:hypothetical protein